MAAQEHVVVYRYGLRDPIDWGDDCDQQLFLMNNLWNSLVEIEQQHRQAYFELMKEDSQVAEVSEQIELLSQEKKEVVAERNSLRKKYKTRNSPGTESLDKRLKELSETLRELSIKAKERRAKARKELSPQMKTLTQKRLAAVKEARRNSGLWWGNYNAVCRSYEFSRRRAWKQGGELRFRSFDGVGRFVNQIQGGMPLGKLFDGSHSQVKINPLPADAYSHPSRGERRRLQRTELTICVYTGIDVNGKRFRRTLTFPMTMHRLLPDEAVIKEIFVRRFRRGTRFHWSANITVTHPRETTNGYKDCYACGIDLGWRKIEDGLRVATIVNSEDQVSHVVLPKVILRKLDYVDELKSKIDQAMNKLRAWLAENLNPDDVLPDALSIVISKQLESKIPSHRHFIKLALLWRDEYPSVATGVLQRIERWRKQDKRLRNEMENLRAKVLSRRADFYRNEAKRIAQQFSIIGMEELDLRRFAQRSTNSDQKDYSATEVRLNRERAALSELRKWIEIQAAKYNTEIIQVGGDSTRQCHCCGHVNSPKDRRWKEIVWQCESCGAKWDQDVNAGYNLRDWATGIERTEYVNDSALHSAENRIAVDVL